MKNMKSLCFSFLTACFLLLTCTANAQQTATVAQTLSEKEKSIISISSLTSRGDLVRLKPALTTGLESGLTINQIKEVIVHLYAYCGFPRSIRGLQTFMEVLDERKAKGIVDLKGAEPSPIDDKDSKYQRGKRILGILTQAKQADTLTGYSAFAPIIDKFLKEHLFADIFERDVLTYGERELATISVLTSIGGVEPMLESHLSISLNIGWTPEQLKQFIEAIRPSVGEGDVKSAQAVLEKVLASRKSK